MWADFKEAINHDGRRFNLQYKNNCLVVSSSVFIISETWRGQNDREVKLSKEKCSFTVTAQCLVCFLPNDAVLWKNIFMTLVLVFWNLTRCIKTGNYYADWRKANSEKVLFKKEGKGPTDFNLFNIKGLLRELIIYFWVVYNSRALKVHTSFTMGLFTDFYEWLQKVIQHIGHHF